MLSSTPPDNIHRTDRNSGIPWYINLASLIGGKNKWGMRLAFLAALCGSAGCTEVTPDVKETPPKPSKTLKLSDLADRFITEGNAQPGLVEVTEQVEGRRWIGKLEGNGNREAVIYIPPGFNPNKKTEIIYHFHGTNSHSVITEPPEVKQAREKVRGKISKKYVGSDRLSQTLKAAEELNKKSDRNVFVVYPTSAGKRGRKGGTAYRNGYDDYWMLKGNNTGDDMEKMHAEVLQTIQSQFGIDASIESITAKGHSAGGKALLNIVRSGFALDRIDSLDADYGWMAECYARARKLNRNIEMNLFVEKGNKNYRKWSRRLQHKKGVRFIPSRTPHGKMIKKFFGWMRRRPK